jgi:hypothetical protein
MDETVEVFEREASQPFHILKTLIFKQFCFFGICLKKQIWQEFLFRYCTGQQTNFEKT